MVVDVVVQSKFLSTPAFTAGVITFTFTVIISVAVHPFALVTVTVYVVVAVGFAIGCAVFVALNPVDGLHEYELLATPIVPIVAEVVMQFKFLSTPALTVGGAVFTITTTASVAVQPFALVTVTVYVFVEEGLAVGIASVTELKPVDGLHK
jgi:Zn-dependent protease